MVAKLLSIAQAVEEMCAIEIATMNTAQSRRDPASDAVIFVCCGCLFRLCHVSHSSVTTISQVRGRTQLLILGIWQRCPLFETREITDSRFAPIITLVLYRYLL